MAYLYPDFARVADIRQQGDKRYSLHIELSQGGRDTLVVIQKNPSRAGQKASDHTINRVLNYVDRNRGKYPVLSGVGQVIFLNLIPWYETYSSRLSGREAPLKDPENMEFVGQYLEKGHPCIIAWGNPPAGLKLPYEALAGEVLEQISEHGNPLFRVGAPTRLGYPRHGQIWGYRDTLWRIGGNHKIVSNL